MNSLFNDLKEKERQTLYIIGNGFDLHHGIPSNYMDFYRWLKTQGKDDFIKDMEIIFPKMENGKFLLWMDFERALKDFDIERVYKGFTKDDKNYFDETIAHQAPDSVKPTISQITNMVNKWAKSIDISGVTKDELLMLPKESFYLTFNYTLTLEEVYKIPLSQICHIHGNTRLGSVIVGHDDSIDEKIYQYEENQYTENSKVELARINNEYLYKNGYGNILNHQDFFKKIKDVCRIVVLGHSLSEIDRMYFGHVIRSTQKETHWHISKHQPSDQEQIDKFVPFQNKEEAGEYFIPPQNRWIFNF